MAQYMVIDGITYSKMIISAAAAIENARQAVNELNVFPVPDGDTGTNMSLTMSAATGDLMRKPQQHLGAAADNTAQALLRGARGNSGVILSLLFRGFAKRVKTLETINGADFAVALTEGVDSAYRAIMKPAEGTVLTVSRAAANKATQASEENDSFEYVLTETLKAAESALAETINQNPVLTKAGVIDAGAKGFCIILDAMLAVLQGREIEGAPASEGLQPRRVAFSEYSSEDIRFAYCTEYIVLRENKKLDPARLRAFLGSIGDSLVLVDDDEIIKVHVHTNNPGKAMEEGLRYGQLTTIKVENMREQHTDYASGVIADGGASGDADNSGGRKIAAASQRYGFVAVCAGDGISTVFRDLDVSGIIEGGQTMNPSTEDILKKIDSTPAEYVFVLPNNKNIILAAEQCVPLSDKKVVILPTKSVAQGMAAMLSFEPSAEPDANREAMIEAISGVSTGQITYAARESSFDGEDIHEGDHMALLNGKLVGCNPDRTEAVNRLAQEIAKMNASFITVFYGEGIEEEEAGAVQIILQQLCPSAEVDLLRGGQPVYYYLISIE